MASRKVEGSAALLILRVDIPQSGAAQGKATRLEVLKQARSRQDAMRLLTQADVARTSLQGIRSLTPGPYSSLKAKETAAWPS